MKSRAEVPMQSNTPPERVRKTGRRRGVKCRGAGIITRGWQCACHRSRAAMSERAVLLFATLLLAVVAVQVSVKKHASINPKRLKQLMSKDLLSSAGLRVRMHLASIL